MLVSFFLAAVAVSAVAAVIDARTGHIPNWLTLGGLLAALTSHLVHGVVAAGLAGGARELVLSLAGALLTAFAPFIVFRKGGMGGGDVKLFAAIGAACLPLGGLEAQSYAFLAAALLAPAQLVYRGVFWRTLKSSFLLLTNPFRAPERRHEVPDELRVWFRLGPSIFVGCAIALIGHVTSGGHLALGATP